MADPSPLPERQASARLFVACELPDEVRDALGRVQNELRRAGARPRWTRPEGIHVTLKFLGEVAVSRVEAISAALAGAIEPFELRVRPAAALGSFGGPSRLRVVWVGLEGDTEALAALAERVEGALAPLGFPREGRPFAAHLTLGRVPDSASIEERRRLAALIQRHRSGPLPPMIVTTVSLIRSVLGPGGSVYDQIASFPQAQRAGP